MSQQSQPGEFASRLRAFRMAKGMTQRELAGDSLSVSYVSLLESGRRTPTQATIETLAAALGCAPTELSDLPGSPGPEPSTLLVRYGQLALEAGHPEQAKQHFDAAQANPTLDPLARTEAAIGAARVLEAQGRLREAARAYEQLVQEAIDSPRYIASLHVVIRWCRCLYELGELTRAVEVGTGAMRELDRLQAWQSDTAVQLLATVAAAHYELGEVAQAERLLEEGLSQADRLRSPKARASVLWNASHLASEEGRHREALELAEEALTYFRHCGDRRAEARLLNLYGGLLMQQQPPRVAEATGVLENALAILEQDTYSYERGYVLTELSRASLLRGQPEQASELAERALDELGPEARLERARAQAALAASLAARGDQTQAAQTFDLAARTLGELKASRQAARAWVELGELLDKVGDSAGAVRAFRQATAAMHLTTGPTGRSADLRTLPEGSSPQPNGRGHP